MRPQVQERNNRNIPTPKEAKDRQTGEEEQATPSRRPLLRRIDCRETAVTWAQRQRQRWVRRPVGRFLPQSTVRAPFYGVFATSVLMTLAQQIYTCPSVTLCRRWWLNFQSKSLILLAKIKGKIGFKNKIPTYFTYAKPTSTNFWIFISIFWCNWGCDHR